MTIRAVFFDLGGVLVRTRDPLPRTALAERVGLDLAGLEATVFATEAASLACVGTISQQEHWQGIVENLGLPESEMERTYMEFFAGDVVDEDLVDFVDSLRPRMRTGMISNAWDGLRPWVVSQGFDRAFDAMTISAEVGYAKPGSEIYELALKGFGVRPEEAIFFDDMQENVDGANALGMQAFLFESTEHVKATVRELSS